MIGAPPDALALYLVSTAIHGFFQHCNIDLRLGPLIHVFSMAELHRWHHARTGRGAIFNYGGILIIWDRLFGTYEAVAKESRNPFQPPYSRVRRPRTVKTALQPRAPPAHRQQGRVSAF